MTLQEIETRLREAYQRHAEMRIKADQLTMVYWRTEEQDHAEVRNAERAWNVARSDLTIWANRWDAYHAPAERNLTLDQYLDGIRDAERVTNHGYETEWTFECYIADRDLRRLTRAMEYAYSRTEIRARKAARQLQDLPEWDPELASSANANSNDVIAPADKKCRCESCRLAKKRKNKLAVDTVHSYSAEPPHGWKKRHRGPLDVYGYHLGVELETDNEDTHTNFRSVVPPDVAANMRRPKGLWLAKSDGSVTGPEFASHPCTLTYWQSQEPALSRMFTMLLHAGYRSHDNDRCGMHVNIERTAFRDKSHLRRFIGLIYGNQRFALRMSQRTESSAKEWAPFCYGEDNTGREYMTERMFQNNWGEKYSALNAPFGEQRYEFRLPRGTLRVDRFMKNLEWTTSMIEYTRVEDHPALKDPSALSYVEWVLAGGDRFPNLVNFINERGTSRLLYNAEGTV